jgi:aquaporin Z
MKRYFAELVGTFVLVFAGVGSAVFAGPLIGFLGISLAFGLALLSMVYVIGPVSGCHINPAVTIGVLLSGKFKGSAADVIGYIIGQLVGAILAALAVLLIAKGRATGYDVGVLGLASNGFGAYSPGGYGGTSAFFAELILTAFLVLVVLGSTDEKAPVGFAGIAIGLALALTNLAAIPITNASINPARSIGPAVFVGGHALAQLWLFIVAPLAGSVVAAIVYRGMRKPSLRDIAPQQAEQALKSERKERQRSA